MNLSDQIYDFRRGIGDMVYAERLALGYLNKAKRDLAKEVQILSNFTGSRSWSSVAHQARYAMPARYALRSGAVRYDNHPLDFKDKIVLENSGQGERHNETSLPRYFALFSGYVELWAVPSTAADTTTLDGAITMDATTITLDSVSGLESKGRALIDSEVISWEYVDTTNLQLTGVSRGLEGTIAAAHLDAAALTERNIEWYGSLHPKKYFARPSRSATLAGSAGSCTDGIHAVYVSFFSKAWASESLPTEVDTITTSSQQIDISDLPVSDDPDVSHVRIYMTTASGSTKYYVTDVANGTTSYSITLTDAELAANSAHVEPVSDVPFQFRDIEQHLAIGHWFFDNEQFNRSNQRFMEAEKIKADWVDELAIELDGGYTGV